MITTEQVKELRDKTGISVMQCKKALEDAGGDTEKALELLKQKSADIASKKGDRELGAGAVAAYIHSNGAIGAMVLLQSETDFVSKNEEFKALARDIAMHVSATDPEFLTSEEIEGMDGNPEELKEKVLLDQAFIKNGDLTIRQLLDNAIQKFGEKIQIGKFVRFSGLDK